MGIEQLIVGGLIAIALTVVILSILLLKDVIKRLWRKKQYATLIECKMQILDSIEKELFAQEPLLSKVFISNFGKTMEVKL